MYIFYQSNCFFVCQLEDHKSQLKDTTRMFEDLKSAHSRLQQEYDALKNMARHDFDSALRVAEALNSEQSDHKKTNEASQAQVKALEEDIKNLKKALDTEQFDHNKTKSASQDSINALRVNLKELEDQVYHFFKNLSHSRWQNSIIGSNSSDP